MSRFDPFLPGRPGAAGRAFGGLNNRQAMGMLLGGFLLAGVLFGLGNALLFLARNFLLAALCNFCGILVAVTALNAAGVALMDAARGAAPRGPAALLVEGTLSFGKFMLFFAGALLGFVFYLMALALLFYLCRIPIAGPVLLVLGLPLTIAGTAALLAGLCVFFSLLAPALWAGDAPRVALGRVAAVLRQRPLEAVASLLRLLLGIAVAGGVAGMLVVAALSQVGLVANTTLGVEVVSASALGGAVPADLEGEALALTAAGMIAITIVLVVGVGLLAAVLMNGACLLWLQLSADIDEAQARWALADLIVASGATVRAMGAGLTVQARALGERAGAMARRFPGAGAARERRCAGCSAAAEPDARFCTRCGARLEA